MKGFILHSFYWKFLKKKENSNNSVVQNYKFVYFPLFKKKKIIQINQDILKSRSITPAVFMGYLFKFQVKVCV